MTGMDLVFGTGFGTRTAAPRASSSPFRAATHGLVFTTDSTRTASQTKAQWDDAAHKLACSEIASPPRTTNTLLRDWLPTAWQTLAAPMRKPLVQEMATHGVALTDLATFGRVHGRTYSMAPYGPHDVVVPFLNALTDLDQAVQTPLGVRDALGWLLTTWAGGMHDPAPRIEEWDTVGLGCDGWVYATAGFTPAETAAALAAGTLDLVRARGMVALRDVDVPVG